MKKKLITIFGLFLIFFGTGTFLNKKEAVENPPSNLAKAVFSSTRESEIISESSQPLQTGVAAQLTKGLPATVTKFVDGDTTYFSAEGREKKVRYLLIDTPEISGGQPFAAEAKARVAELLTGAERIELEYDIGKRQDHYGRELMYVWVDGKLLQEILAREGLAMVRYIEAPNTRYLEKVKRAEAEAKKGGLGIWSVEDYGEDGGYEQLDEPKTQEQGNVADRQVYVAPNSGSKYHLDRNCRGLRKASKVVEMSESEAKVSYDLCGYED